MSSLSVSNTLTIRPARLLSLILKLNCICSVTRVRSDRSKTAVTVRYYWSLQWYIVGPLFIFTLSVSVQVLFPVCAYHIYPKDSDSLNNVDTGQTLQNAASDQSLHCLALI